MFQSEIRLSVYSSSIIHNTRITRLYPEKKNEPLNQNGHAADITEVAPVAERKSNNTDFLFICCRLALVSRMSFNDHTQDDVIVMFDRITERNWY